MRRRTRHVAATTRLVTDIDAPNDRIVARLTRTRRPSWARVIAAMATGRHIGDCFGYAWREMTAWCDAGKPDPPLVVVHGTVAGPGGRIDHAWVERGGYAYDWQGAIARRPPIAAERFVADNGSERTFIYDSRQLAAEVLAHGHFGPYGRPGRPPQ